MTDEQVKEFYKLARAYCIKKHIWFDDDLIQDLVMYLCDKFNKYDESKGSVSTFAFMCFKNFMYDHKKDNQEIIVDCESEYFVSNYEDCYKKLIVDEIMSLLSEDEVVMDWINGLTYDEIAKKHNKHRTTISRYITKHLEDIRQEYLGG